MILDGAMPWKEYMWYTMIELNDIGKGTLMQRANLIISSGRENVVVHVFFSHLHKKIQEKKKKERRMVFKTYIS